MARDIKELEARIGYTFGDGALLLRALTHTSYVNEQKGGRIASNERLEFLGDSVLSLVVCRYLFEAYPTLPEGRLTVLRKNVVCQKALADYATKIGLGAYLLLGRGEERDGREKPKLLEDAFEALLGAMYLDCGCLSAYLPLCYPLSRVSLPKMSANCSPLRIIKPFCSNTCSKCRARSCVMKRFLNRALITQKPSPFGY